MGSTLIEIQAAAMDYADTLSKILKVGVTIVDEQMHRIAGTGRTYACEARKQADVSKTAGLLLQTLQSGQLQIYEHPGEYDTCKQCGERQCCQAKYLMAAPIMVNGEAKGVLAFMTSNQVEKERMQKKKDLYRQFLAQFSDLISLKLLETSARQSLGIYTELMKMILNYADAGVLVFDCAGQLVLANHISRRFLAFWGVLPVKACLTVVNQENEKTDVILTLEQQSCQLSGRLCHIGLADYSDLFIFSEDRSAAANGDDMAARTGSSRILGDSKAAVKIRKQILQYADSKATVLITGESGTEKIETAQAIHEESPWKTGPFIMVSCKNFSDDALEKELMGILSETTKRGRQGKFEQASGGTLYLEDVDSLSLAMQAKLLRVLKEEKVIRIGGCKPVRINTRIMVSATKDLGEMMKTGNFSEDLFYHLFVLPVHIPPLHARKEDVRVLGMKYLLEAARKNGKMIAAVDPLFWEIMENYSWPGNVCQLKAAMEYVANAMDRKGNVTVEWIPENIMNDSEKAPAADTAVEFNLKKLEEAAIRNALQTFGNDPGGKELAAQKLGIGIATLYRKMKQYNL